MIEPSVKFLQTATKQPNVLKMVERIKKEFDIYSYMSDFIPTTFTDKHWEKMLAMPSVKDRVRLWNFMAVKEHREKLDLIHREQTTQSIKEFQQTQAEIFEKGGMGYGNGLYRLILNPLAHAKNAVETLADSRQYIAQRLNDQPKIALDFQFFSTEKISFCGRLSNNLRTFLSYNRYTMQNPFPLSLVNVDRSHPQIKEAFDVIGFVNRSESRSSVLLPEVYIENPLTNESKNKEIVYISRYAKDLLDGPLNQYAFILPVTFDNNRESIDGARKGGFRLMSLPFKKYVKWQSGCMLLPLSGIQKVLETVSRTGGDWHRALHENIAKRHLLSQEENKANQGVYQDIRAYRAQEQIQIVTAINEALKNDSVN